MSSASDASPPDPCCICMSMDDYQGTLLVQCVRCSIRVHVKCYGVSIEGGNAASWLCQACEYVTSAPSPCPTPQCAVCPIAGGALRLTDQRDVWCHVLCINWIPELYHSLTGVMDEAVKISLYEKSRSTLRCVICGVRGGCIQCVSGRCAKAFHVVCAFRSPSSLVFTGYNSQNQQVYHCKTHLSDVDTTKYEMVDNSWRALPEAKKYEEEHPPTTEPKCRFCGNKVTLPNKEGHETQCLLGWMTRSDARKRKQELDRLGVKAVEIVCQDTEKSPAKKGKRSKSSPNARKNTRETNGKFKRQETPMRPCPECGEHIRETLMMGHMRNSCPKSKHAMKRKMSPRNGTQEDVEVADMTDVLFASWPGQNSGAPMDSTYFWKVVESHFYKSSVLEKKRMGQLCKSLCGMKLEDSIKRRRPLQASDIHCRDTIRLERNAEDPTQTLVLQKCTHKCDFLMRASHCRCLSDPLAKPMIEIRHNAECTKPRSDQTGGSGSAHVPDGAEANMRVQFKNGENAIVACKYSMRVSPDSDSMNQHAADNGTFASTFLHDAVSTLAGFDMQTKKVPLAPDDKLLISLDSCDQVESVQLGNNDEINSQAMSIVSVPADTPLTDEFTPAINLLLEHLKGTTEQNRSRIRALYKKLKSDEDKANEFQLKAQTTDLYYREFAAWKRLCSSLLIGYRRGEQPEKDKKNATESDEQGGSTEDEDDAVDDGTCVVCFDGQSPETNPIIFCDRCELAVHQRCYGMAKVPSNEFICDRCRAMREGLDPARDVFCQLCSLSDGAFKRTIDGKWVHVVCALWCPKVWIGNLFELSEISLVGTTSQVRFLDSVKEIEARIVQASSGQHQTNTPKNGDHPEVPAIELGSLCVHCRVACGRTVQCCHPDCSTSFHPLCGWYDGLPMTISLGDERYMYAGGGAGLNFQMLCSRHLPEHYPASEQLAQRRRRARFRIDSYFVMRNKDNYSSGAKKQTDDASSLLSGSIVQAVLSAESKLTATETDSTATDWTDLTVCSACFEYCAPLVGKLTDVNMLHRRQFMIRCQYCNVYIHPECCISDIGSSATIFRSNWICERCTQTGGNETPECVVCAKATDYLMPCIDPPVPVNQANGKSHTGSKAAITAICPAAGGGQQLWLQNMQRQVGNSKPPLQPKGPESNGVTSHPSPNKWIHVYCGKWQKAKTVKRQHMLCAYTPALKPEGMATRCEFCDKKEGLLANCAQCSRRFHPICAAQKKLYCARSNRSDWKFYCEAHPPPDAAFDVNRQSWITQEILGQLQDLRRSLERGRMLLEMSRQRDRQHKRLLNLCKLPLMETVIDVILKKRPTPQMKEVYRELTGESLTDVPHRAKVAPAASRNSRNRVRNSRAAKRSASQAAAAPERSPKRRRTRADSVDSSTGEHTPRRSSRRKPLRFDQEGSENEDEEDQEDEAEAQKKVWENLAVPTEVDDFDFIVAEHYPELVAGDSKMSETTESEGTDKEELVQFSSHDGLASLFASPAPSTAGTIESREEVHNCDEWNLFADAALDPFEMADNEDSRDDQSDEEAAELSVEGDAAIGLETSQQDDTERQDTSANDAAIQIPPSPQIDGNVVSNSAAPLKGPAPQREESGDVHRRIQVVVRVRPPSNGEGKVVVTAGVKEGTSLCVQATSTQGGSSVVTECTFDRVFMGGATQEDVFAAIEPSVQACLEGYNATVFAYGQTGTGKTHTLFGQDLDSPSDKSKWGVVPRTLRYLLDQAASLEQKSGQVELHLSFLQIYNDRLFDVLTDRMRQKPLLLREQPAIDGTTCITVRGLSSEKITSFSNAMQIIHQGHTRRCVRETELNLSSSRSHAIVQLNVTTHCPALNGEGRVLRKARLNLVDLAGSEKWNTDVEMEDVHSQELKNINASLSALGNCIAALAETGRKHIPYRDSTLTRVLQDSFGGNTQSCLIATINATQQTSDETIRTLQFADRARSVLQTIRVNEVADGSSELLMAKIQIVKLRERLESEQRRRHDCEEPGRERILRELEATIAPLLERTIKI
ncbi:hypothetical protein PInf_016819 [Phytophthora infestans]|nr:hypothetical protein PInf_016819 [Phytophthora infestans]